MSAADIKEVQKLLDAINSAIKEYDPALKSRAVEVLLSAAFPGARPTPPKNTAQIDPGAKQAGFKPGEWADVGALFEATKPKTDADKALVAAYFFQGVQGEKDLAGRTLNDALKHLGHGIGNITNAVQANIESTPALMLQVKKFGKTKQAQKKYRVTQEGMKRVQEMVNSPGEDA